MIKKGFTVAEVLLTFVIIGIVAALTIPSITNTYSDKMYVSALKKNFSVISNAFNLAKKFDYDDYEDWSHKDSDNETIYRNYTHLRNYMNVLRECKNKEGCWSDDITKGPNGMVVSNATKMGIGGNVVTFTLNDGTNVCIDYYSKADIIKNFGVERNLLDNPLAIWVDVNGDKKPNRLGRDVFSFILTSQGLVPSGADNHSEHCKDTGFDCSAKYIYKY